MIYSILGLHTAYKYLVCKVFYPIFITHFLVFFKKKNLTSIFQCFKLMKKSTSNFLSSTTFHLFL